MLFSASSSVPWNPGCEFSDQAERPVLIIRPGGHLEARYHNFRHQQQQQQQQWRAFWCIIGPELLKSDEK